MNWNTIFSVAIGFIGGTLFQLIVSRIEKYFREKRRTKDLIKELEINKRKLDKWIVEFDNLKEKIMLGNIKDYYGFFDYYTFIITTVTLLQQDGLLYRKLDLFQIEKLQDMINYFNGAVGQLISDEINKAKEKLNKDNFISFVNFHLNKVKDYKSDIESIVNVLHK